LLLAAVTCATGAAADRCELIDGRYVEGTVASIDDQGQITFAQAPPLPWEELRLINRAVDDRAEATPNGKIRVELVGRGQILADGLDLADEEFVIRWGMLDEPLTLSIDAVQAIVFEDVDSDEGFAKAVAAPSNDFDQLFVKVDGPLQVVRGLIEQIDSQQAVFSWKGEPRRLGRDQLAAIVLADAGRGPARTGKCLVELVDGSSLLSPPPRLADGQLTLAPTGGPAVTVPWSRVRKVRVFSPRLKYLSEMKPSGVVQQPLVTLPRPWQKNRSVAGGPLTLRGRTFETGVGVHSRCHLTYTLDQQGARFLAVIGIDDTTNGRGDCEFVVLGDGRELLRRRVTGKDPPQPINVEIQAVRQLTLAVEPGQDLDLADHADWCDARILLHGTN
jgi:hypothetical protein